ncbi:NMT1/THI5 like protein [Pelotomaculum schinkii]|uniref:NMT1/THI5 like protein n=1 Tax=Pelotomaculum schinkii TaxID=78350 RepID=A0A4Y7RE27_9FIRM|nr:TAXI family TRAP transporter solute-binding subunit [Pelotomaculum schinkii]TEB07275.1 NMT1/THI5 like protein [Pelotomaculum schinkii]
MFKRTKIYSIIAVLALGIFLMAGCGGQGAQQETEQKAQSGANSEKYQVAWGTAPAGGAWQVIGTAMLEDVTKANPNISGSTSPIGGFANVIGVSEGKLQVAFSLSATTGDAWEGKGPFEERGELKNFRILATLFPEPTHITVLADSGVNSIEQLKGKRITPGPKGSAVEQDTKRVLDAYGLTYNDFQSQMISFDEAAQQMLDGHIDSILYGAMICPAPNIVNVNSQKQIKLLSLSDSAIDQIVKSNTGTIPYTIPAGTYKGVDYPVNGIATLCNIIVREDMPDDVAYSIVKTIAENFDRYPTVASAMSLAKKEEMGRDMGIPYHPGALKYYKEQGWIK